MTKTLLDAPAPPLPNKVMRPIPQFPGFTANRTCGNCEHFEIRNTTGQLRGWCHNGISQRNDTRAIDGCGYGFYPATDRFPLKAGPGGTWA